MGYDLKDRRTSGVGLQSLWHMLQAKQETGCGDAAKQG